MAPPADHDITEFLHSWREGDEAALEKLTPLVYRELHRLAAHYMRREKVEHTLQATALVNEAYVRLIDWKNVQWQNRGHFFGVAAQVMRRILVDYARSRCYDTCSKWTAEGSTGSSRSAFAACRERYSNSSAHTDNTSAAANGFTSPAPGERL